ncbi:MAG: TOBE domain-containing protein [Haloarculaceae archaeon]
MKASVDAQLRAGEVAFRGADAALLRAVADEGSVSGASETLGRSRARALNRIETLEEAFGPLVERERGGATGGGSTLTQVARDLIVDFERLRATLVATATAEESIIYGTVTERDDELCVVQTEAGKIRARFVDLSTHSLSDVLRVQVSVRSDAVTLQTPPEAPAGDATSVRNRFEGTVVDIDPGETIGEVTVDIGPDNRLIALLTGESFDRLALSTGDSVVASFKATAARAIPVGWSDCPETQGK